MSYTRVALAIIAIVLATSLQILEILRYRNQDFTGDVIMALVLCGLILGAYSGPRWLKWIPGVIMAIAAIVSAVSVVEGAGGFYVVIAICYSVAAWMVLTLKQTAIKEQRRPKLAPLEEELYGRDGNEPGKIVAHYPYLATRIKSAFVDSMLVLATLMAVMMATQAYAHSTTIKIITAILLVLLYEPILTVHSATVGQRLMGIRVRSAVDPTRKINILQSVFRYSIKIALGWISFLFIYSNEQRRAIHDLVSGSVIVEAKQNDPDTN